MRDSGTVGCSLCEYDIKPGDRREIFEGETAHSYCVTIERARRSYKFFLLNPENDPRWSKGFYYRDLEADREYPILENTGGLTVHITSEQSGDPLPVKREFIEAFGLGWHWLMCYTPSPDRLGDTIKDILEDYYDGVPGIHERWALANLLSHALLSDAPLPHEWKPLIEVADQTTKFGVPEVSDGF